MKLVALSHQIDSSGAPRSLLKLVEGLQKIEGVDLSVISMKGGALEYNFNKNVRNLTVFGGGGNTKKLLDFFRLVFLFIKIRPDVVIINSASNIRALVATRILNINSILYLREFNEMLSNGAVKLFLRRKSILLAKHIIAVARENARWAEQLGFPKSKISVVHNGISLDEVCSEKDKPVPAHVSHFASGHKVVGIAGHFSHRKGVDYFIDVAHKLQSTVRSCRFLMVGDFESYTDRQDFERACERLGLRDEILITGYVENIYQYIRLMNVLCLTSRSEALPRVVLEAMSLGVPVVAFDVGGTKELLSEDYPFLVQSYDTEKFYHCCNILLNERGIAHETSEKLLLRASSFSMEKVIEKVYEIASQVKNKTDSYEKN